MSFHSILSNLRKRGLKDILSKKRRAVYRESSHQQRDGIHLEFDEALAYCEQVVYRASLCSDCLKAGQCKHCGCLTPHIFFVRENECSGGNWLEMAKTTEEWEQFKKERKIEIGIKL